MGTRIDKRVHARLRVSKAYQVFEEQFEMARATDPAIQQHYEELMREFASRASSRLWDAGIEADVSHSFTMDYGSGAIKVEWYGPATEQAVRDVVQSVIGDMQARFIEEGLKMSFGV